MNSKYVSDDRVKRRILRLLILSVVLIAAAIIPFVLTFSGSGISSDLSDWALFGDYFSGAVNTTVSIISVIILAYITVLIPRLDSRENQKLFIQQKKIEAYDEFAKHFTLIQTIPERVASQKKLMANLSNVESDIKRGKEILNAGFQELSHSVEQFRETYHFIYNYGIRYAHIFEYDFRSDEFGMIIDTSKKLMEHLESNLHGLSQGKLIPFEMNKEELVEYIKTIGKVCDSLTGEM